MLSHWVTTLILYQIGISLEKYLAMTRNFDMSKWNDANLDVFIKL